MLVYTHGLLGSRLKASGNDVENVPGPKAKMISNITKRTYFSFIIIIGDFTLSKRQENTLQSHNLVEAEL